MTIGEPKIDVHKAVKAAFDFFKKLFADEKIENLQLEEVALSEDAGFWLITLGYDDPAIGPISEQITRVPFFRPRPLRKYKVVQVDANTGSGIAIKNR